MAHSDSTARSTGRLDPAVVGGVLARLGVVVLALAVPVAAAALAGLLATTDPPAAGVAVALGAMDGPLLGGTGLPWLFHVAALAGLCGCWFLGAGLLLEGLFD